MLATSLCGSASVREKCNGIVGPCLLDFSCMLCEAMPCRSLVAWQLQVTGRACTGACQPAVTGVMNGASLMTPQLPNKNTLSRLDLDLDTV